MRISQRRRLAMELHDNLGQRVSLLAAELGVLRQQLANGADTPERAISIAVQTVARLAAHTAEIGDELQRIANAGRRMPMDAAELTAALNRLCHDISRVFRIAIHLDCSTGPVGIASDVAHCLYRVVQEALQNVVKHSHATNVTVRVTSGATIALSVVDDGNGFDESTMPSAGNGLSNMRERVHQFGGTLEIRSADSTGTNLQITLPQSTTRHATLRPSSGRTRRRSSKRPSLNP